MKCILKLISVFLIGLALQGCATTVNISSIDTSIEDLSSSVEFSNESFADGSYRFSQAGFRVFRGSIQEAIIERRYDDALADLIQSNSANDESYFSMGVIAENQGYYEGAMNYYTLAYRLNTEHHTPSLNGCPWIVDGALATNPQTYNSACFGIDSSKMLQAINRVKSKANESWTATIIEYEDGRIYIGDTNDAGKPEGQGELTAPSGDFYYGYFQNGVQNGPGTLTINTGSSILYFKGFFMNGEPTRGYLSNPGMALLGSPFGHVMDYRNGGFYYAFGGGALGSRPADNNWWFANSLGEGFGRALRQGFVYQAAGISPLLSTSDPLISQVCEAKSTLIASGANAESLCE